MTQSDAPAFGAVKTDPDWKIAIIRSVWYPKLTSALVESAKATLLQAGIPAGNVAVIDAPGSYEIPLLAKAAFEDTADAVLAFGIIVQGVTHHASVIAEQSAAGCMQVQLQADKPLVYEVLYVDSMDDAVSRCIGPDSKGPIAAKTLLTQLARLAELR